MATLPRPVGVSELYVYSVRVTSANGKHCVLFGWAPRGLPLDGVQYDKLGFYAQASDGNLTSYGQKEEGSVAEPSPGEQGLLPQGGIVRCEYDRGKGTIGFGWPGKAVVVCRVNVAKEPQLFPAFLLGYGGDSVELV